METLFNRSARRSRPRERFSSKSMTCCSWQRLIRATRSPWALRKPSWWQSLPGSRSFRGAASWASRMQGFCASDWPTRGFTGHASRCIASRRSRCRTPTTWPIWSCFKSDPPKICSRSPPPRSIVSRVPSEVWPSSLALTDYDRTRKRGSSAGGIARSEWERVDQGYRIRRGELPGAGVWTHQYADAGRSGASSEQRVRLPLKMLWFGGLGPADIVSRHYRTPSPLAINGCLFVPGNELLHAVDAYNGRVIWQRKFPGVGTLAGSAPRRQSRCGRGRSVRAPRHGLPSS